MGGKGDHSNVIAASNIPLSCDGMSTKGNEELMLGSNTDLSHGKHHELLNEVMSNMKNMTSIVQHALELIRIPKKEPLDVKTEVQNVPMQTIKHTLSKFIKTNFTITPAMSLTEEEAQLSAYVFHPFNDPGEVLFKLDDFEGSRKDFMTLCPAKIVETEIAHMMALKVNWTQKQMLTPTKWTLPLAFVHSINKGDTIEELIEEYIMYWIPNFENLSHIYVPIEDICGLWYLMVASIDDKMLYHIDTFFEEQNVNPRQTVIQNVWEVITQMLQSQLFPTPFRAETLNGQNWTLEEDVLRMRLTMDLLLGDHNVYKTKLKNKSLESWRTKRYASAFNKEHFILSG
ncbi:hypothetical protein TSUD_392210 [Trifolium subterraneum]|uniref:Ubiquitin-like protease family profile domain-containing protein n=1 Tax=Trifolium subterraneum TaxID=3900 RepID=A0A2Z6MIS8_TRISU|nr:hypothetical protein TSUD_392210 [Trifolium subterraneum]